MKRIVRLMVVTLILLVGASVVPNIVNEGLPVVKVHKMEMTENKETVFCNGKIEEKESEKISLDIPVSVEKVYVKPGDQVKKGEILAKIDRAKTQQTLSTQYSWMLTNPPSQESNYDIEKIPKEVSSPVNGIVSSINIKEGSVSTPTDALMIISKSDSLQVVADISENLISQVKLNQPVVITGAGFKDIEYSGKVSKISPAAKQAIIGASSQTVVGITIDINTPDENLKPGFSTKNEIITSHDENILIVPYEAVQQDENQQEYAYIYSRGRAIRRDIQTGRELSSGLQVLSGLTTDDSVVLNPEKVLSDGSFVRLKK